MCAPFLLLTTRGGWRGAYFDRPLGTPLKDLFSFSLSHLCAVTIGGGLKVERERERKREKRGETHTTYVRTAKPPISNKKKKNSDPTWADKKERSPLGSLRR